MLEMRAVYTSYEREEYLAPFGRTPEDGKTVVCARYEDRFVGAAYYAADGDTATLELYALVPGYTDETDYFLLGKAALNVMELHGIKTVLYPDPSDEVMAKRLGFRLGADGVWTLSLVGYFTAAH